MEFLRENNRLVTVYRVGEVPQNFKGGSYFFTDDLDYYGHSDTNYSKDKAKQYTLDMSGAKIWYPISELDLEPNTWSAIWGKITDFDKFGINYEYVEDNEEYAITDTDWLAQAGQELGYDITIITDIPSDRGYGKSFNEYIVHNSDFIIPVIAEDLDEIEMSNEYDSEGNQLTKAQAEFFRNSKVRDSRGRLLVVYHGTSADFDTFSSDYSWDNFGFHFGTLKAAQERDSTRIKKVYLNITKPLVMKEDLQYWDAVGFMKYFLENEGLVKDFPVLRDDWETLKHYWVEYDMYDSPDESWWDSEFGDIFREALYKSKYDGVVYTNWGEDAGSTSYMAFYPNQIKSITNKNPTSRDNINEGLEGSLFSETQLELLNKFLNTQNSNIDIISAQLKDESTIECLIVDYSTDDAGETDTAEYYKSDFDAKEWEELLSSKNPNEGYLFDTKEFPDNTKVADVTNEINELPRYLYHGTSLSNYKQIRKDGYLYQGKKNWGASKTGVVYLTISEDDAQEYCDRADLDYPIVILKIPTKTLDLDKLYIDSNEEYYLDDDTNKWDVFNFEYADKIPLENTKVAKTLRESYLNEGLAENIYYHGSQSDDIKLEHRPLYLTNDRDMAEAFALGYNFGNQLLTADNPTVYSIKVREGNYKKLYSDEEYDEYMDIVNLPETLKRFKGYDGLEYTDGDLTYILVFDPVKNCEILGKEILDGDTFNEKCSISEAIRKEIQNPFKSSVVKEKVYHGARDSRYDLNMRYASKYNPIKGLYFTSDYKWARKYGDYNSYFIDIKNPIELEEGSMLPYAYNILMKNGFSVDKELLQNFKSLSANINNLEYIILRLLNKNTLNPSGDLITKLILKAGYDGVITNTAQNQDEKTFIVFSKRQVVLADNIEEAVEECAEYLVGGTYQTPQLLEITDEYNNSLDEAFDKNDTEGRLSLEKATFDFKPIRVGGLFYEYSPNNDDSWERVTDAYNIYLDDEYVGGVALDTSDDNHIQAIYVKPNKRKMNIAGRTVEILKDRYKELSFNSLPNAKGFWEKQGAKLLNYNDDSGTYYGHIGEAIKDLRNYKRDLLAKGELQEKLLYHRSNNEFTEFDSSKVGTNQGRARNLQGYWFFDVDDTSKTHGEYLYTAEVDTSNFYKTNSRTRLINKNNLKDFVKKYLPHMLDQYGEIADYQIGYLKEKISSQQGIEDLLSYASRENNISTTDIIKDFGYNGIVYGDHEYLVFDKKDIKNFKQVMDIVSESTKKDKIIYRGESDTFSSKYTPYAGVFFGPTKNSVKGWGTPKAYLLSGDAKIFEGIASDDYCDKNNLYNKKYKELKVFKDYADIDSLSYFLNLTNEEKEKLNERVVQVAGNRFVWYDLWDWCTQLVAKIELEKQGYDGALWAQEDWGNPVQYQIWNKEKIKQVE